jgi:hypothetical protein
MAGQAPADRHRTEEVGSQGIYFVRRLNVSGVIGTVAALAVLTTSLAVFASKEATVEELKARLSSTSVGERPQICLQIAEKQLESADKFYAAVETEKAQAAVTDVTAFAEQARDYAIQSRKHQKQTEIAVRRMIRKLEDIKRTVTLEEQAPLTSAISHLQRVRDDLLMAMFPKGQK